MATRRQFLALGTTVVAGVVLGWGRRAGGPGLPGEAQAAQVGAADPLPLPEPGARTDANPERPLVIALLSDTHTQPADGYFARTINAKIGQALVDLQQFQPDLWIVDGDVTDHGLPGEYAAFGDLVRRGGIGDRLLVSAGNHEFYAAAASDLECRRRFREAFGLPETYCNHVHGGLHFVMLADEQYKSAPRNPDWAWITPEQLRWFERVLTEHRDRFTIVSLHQPLQETVAGTWADDGFAGSGQAAELRAIWRRNPQIRLWLSGHTHYRLELAGQVDWQRRTLFAALGSTCYQYVTAAGAAPSGRIDRSASQSRVLEVWSDRAVLRARDHEAGRWLDDLAVTIPRT